MLQNNVNNFHLYRIIMENHVNNREQCTTSCFHSWVTEKNYTGIYQLL